MLVMLVRDVLVPVYVDAFTASERTAPEDSENNGEDQEELVGIEAFALVGKK